MMQPFSPQTKKEEVVNRTIIDAIRARIAGWRDHATIITGPYGSGKSVALEEVLRGVRSVLVHIVCQGDFERQRHERLGLDGLCITPLKEVLRRVRGKLEKLQGSAKFPIIVLKFHHNASVCMGRVSSFAKELSSDKLDRAPAHVIALAEQISMAFAFDPGCRSRCEDIWVGDLTQEEAQRLLALNGHRSDWQQFVDACCLASLAVRELVWACQLYEKVATRETLEAERANLEGMARQDVRVFLDCKIEKRMTSPLQAQTF